MADPKALLGAGADWRSFLDRIYGNVALRYAAETDQKEEAKGLKRIDEEPALRCLEDTVHILIDKLPEEKKKVIIESLVAKPGRRRPQFEYLEQFKDKMQQMLEQLSRKESAALLQKEFNEEQSKNTLKFIEGLETLKAKHLEDFN